MLTWADTCYFLKGILQDITLEADTPIFCTSKAPIIFVKNSVVDERQTEMMQVRWHHFQLRHQLRLQDCKDITACANCFAMLVI